MLPLFLTSVQLTGANASEVLHVSQQTALRHCIQQQCTNKCYRWTKHDRIP